MNRTILQLIAFAIYWSSCVGIAVNFTNMRLSFPFSNSFVCCETYAPLQKIFFGLRGDRYEGTFMTYEGSYQIPTYFIPEAQLLAQTIDELRIASVQPAFGSPFPIGDWKLGDIFIGDVQGSITKITDASIVMKNWTMVVPGDQILQTFFDRTGTVYDGDLIATSSSNIFRILANGTFIRLPTKKPLSNYEGLDIVPNNVTRYGPLSGTILLPQNPIGSSIVVVDKDGNVTSYDAPNCQADQVYVVHEYDNFYGLEGNGLILSLPWTQLSQLGLQGEILIMCEFPARPNSGLIRMYWNATVSEVQFEHLSLAAGSIAPEWFEHGCFSRGAVGNVLPGGFSFCYYSTIPGPKHLSAYQVSVPITQNYLPNNFVGSPKPQNGTTIVSIIQDSLNGFYLQVVNGNPTNGSGSVIMQIVFDGPSDSRMLLRIQDSLIESLWVHNQGRFVWKWTSGSSGLVIGPIAAIPGLKAFTFHLTVIEHIGIDTFKIVGGDGSYTQSLAPGKFSTDLIRQSCSCGNGVVDDVFLEQCDYGKPNSTCCDPHCRLKQSNFLCNNPSDRCMTPSYCTSTDGFCPPVQQNPSCNCTFPRYGLNCAKVRCDLLNTCGSCNTYPECSWCCGESNQTCVEEAVCENPFPRNCSDCTLCGLGTCDCGVCTCPVGFTGFNCSQTYDCTLELVPVGATPKTIDVCGICGGNGTTCIGCDGIPFGKQLDPCGICGGDGTSCFDPCPATSCSDCIYSSDCVWCSADKRCVLKGIEEASCSSDVSTSCDSEPVITTAVIVGASIGTAAVIGIVIGAVAFLALGAVGTKKGYDYFMLKHREMGNAITNPMYDDHDKRGQNPFYSEGSYMRQHEDHPESFSEMKIKNQDHLEMKDL